MEESKIYRAHSIQELQHILRASNNVVPVAGGTSFSINNDDAYIRLASEILPLNSIPQLHILHKSDRYIDFGSCVSLDEIIERGRKHVPAVLYDALERAGNVAIREVATIGGNLATKNPFTASFLPLFALDAQCEICTKKDIFWMPISKYLQEEQKDESPRIILRIRVKEDEWTYHAYKKIKNGQYMDEIPIFLFLAKVQKNTILDVRLLFADKSLVRSKEFDNLLLGRALPISKEELKNIMIQAENAFTPDIFSSLFNRKCFFNLLEQSLYKM